MAARAVTLQWGRGLSTPEIWQSGLIDDTSLDASMGPGSFDPGNADQARAFPRSDIGFNGAGVFRPRKCASAWPSAVKAHPLQWGRGLSTPEISGGKATMQPQSSASMGPGSFDPGNRLS